MTKEKRRTGREGVESPGVLGKLGRLRDRCLRVFRYDIRKNKLNNRVVIGK